MRQVTAANGGVASVLAGLCLLLLAACAETQLAAHLASSADGEARGHYKVGNPYQINGVWYAPEEDFHYDATGIASWYGPGFHGRRTANGEIFDQNALTAAHPTLQMPSIARVTNLQNGRSVVVRINDRGPFAHGRIIDLSRQAAELLGFRAAGITRVRVVVLTDESLQVAQAYGRQGGRPPRPAEGRVVAAAAGGAERSPGTAAPSRRAASSPRGPLAPPPVTPQTAAAPPRGPERLLPATPGPAAGALAMAPPPTTTVPTYGPPLEPAAGNVYVQVGAFTVFANADRLRSRLAGMGPVTIASTAIDGVDFHRVRLGPFASVDPANDALAQAIADGHGEARLVVD